MTSTAAKTRTLSTADERREDILRAAEQVFAERGIHGTATAAVAKAAGISHAYLFRLFPTKTALAVALTHRCHDRILEAFRAAAASCDGRGGEAVMQAMGEAYGELLQDRNLLVLQLHIHAAAASEPEMRDAARDGFRRLVEFVQEAAGVEDEDIQRFFAMGMLMNVLGAMDAPAVAEPWARLLLKDDERC